MKKTLKKGLVFTSIYLILLLCVFMMSNRIERLEENGKEEVRSVAIFHKAP